MIVRLGEDMQDDNRPTEESATERKTGIRKQALLASFMTGVLLALATFLLWSNALQNRDTMLLSAARIMSSGIAQQVKQIVDNNLHVLETFADNWQDGPPAEERDYLSLATPLQARFPPFRPSTGSHRTTSSCMSPRSRGMSRRWVRT